MHWTRNNGLKNTSFLRYCADVSYALTVLTFLTEVALTVLMMFLTELALTELALTVLMFLTELALTY